MSDSEGIRRGIEAYQAQQTALIELLRERGQLTDQEFDAEFDQLGRDLDGRVTRKAPRFSWWGGMSGDTIILAPMQWNERAKMIHLAQLMAALGDIEIVKEGERVIYRLPKQPESAIA